MGKKIERIPAWALCALINDDWTGIDDNDYEMIAAWLSSNRLCVIAPVDLKAYFYNEPAFEEPCMVVDCTCETY